MRADNRTQKNTKRKKRRKKRYLLRFILAAALCTGLYFVTHIDYFTINGIAVAGNDDVTDEEIVKLSEIEAGENIFDIHPRFAEKRIKKNLYIENVNVKRKFPDKVEIVVSERKGAAQFVNDKEYIITDIEGSVLEISKEERKVTLVEDVEILKAKPEKTVEVENGQVYNKAMRIIKAAEDNDLYFKRIQIKGNDIRAYVYDKLVCEGKYNYLLECIESGALKAVVFDLYQKDIEKGTINIGDNNYCSFTK